MKKIYFMSLCLFAASLTASAAGVLTQKSQKTYADIVTANNAVLHNVIEKASDGNIFTAGVFDKTFDGLEPVSGSSYIIKSDADFNASWKVAIQGSATVTAMAADADGGVYVAGNLADEVNFTGTDDKVITVEGYKQDDAPTTSQAAAFFAHYDKDGKLLGVKTLLPEQDAALTETGMYFPMDGDIYCNVNRIYLAGNRLYAGLTFTNNVKTTDAAGKELSVSGGSYNANGEGWWYSATTATAVLELDTDLNAVSFPVCVKTDDFTKLTTSYNVVSSTMTMADGHLYLALVTTGTTWLKAFDEEAKEITFKAPVEDNEPVGFALADINLAARTSTISQWNGDVSHSSGTRINDIAAKDGNLIISGYFQSKLPFNTAVTATGYSDAFMASVSKTGTVNWATVTGFTEDTKGGNNQIRERYAASTIVGNTAFLGVYTDSISDGALCQPLFYTVNLSDGSFTQLETTDFVSGLQAYDGSTLIEATQPREQTGVTFTNYDSPTGIAAVRPDKTWTGDGRIYNLNGQQVSRAVKGVYIKNGKKYIAE